jgi:hypothetical protein
MYPVIVLDYFRGEIFKVVTLEGRDDPIHWYKDVSLIE